MPNNLIIGLDLGDTVFDRSKPKIPLGKGHVRSLCEGAASSLQCLSDKGHELVVVSKIDQGDEARVTLSLTHWHLMPHLIDPEKVRFCYGRSDKGLILCQLKADVIVDDRIEVHNAAHECGVRHKILFVGVRDDRKEDSAPTVAFSGLLIAHNWKEVYAHIQSIAES